jgi:4-hydroxybenzoate polyprenyltransferase
MISRLRLVVLLVRPAVIVLLATFTATGLAQAGRGADTLLLARALAAVFGFLLFSVAVNDLADEAIDRVNLPGQRPLVVGAVTHREFMVIGLTGGAVAVAASATLHWPAVIVTAAGLCVSAAYSLRPVRLADRGAVASLVLPACYVAVPYLLGALAASGTVRPDALFLLTGLYLGFIGRILLKDFRDVRGDALFGKRTFLIRHGRVWTCVFSACCWLAGTCVILAAAHQLTAVLVASEAGCLAGALTLLRALSADRGARRDESIIAAIAILGRGMILLLLAHLSMVYAGWAGARYDAVIALLFLLTAGPALSMVRHGPVSRLTIPAWGFAGSAGDEQAAEGRVRYAADAGSPLS